MPTPPALANVKTYLGDSSTYTDAEIQSALDAETLAQSRVVRLPVDADPEDPSPYPADLAEALLRRVHHNLVLRGLPLGIQASIAESAVQTNRVGGTDAEVARLERPFRKWSIA